MSRSAEKGNILSLPEAKETRTMAFNKSHYGEVIRSSRLRAGLTQPQLATMIGVKKN